MESYYCLVTKFMKWAGSGLNVAHHISLKWTDALTFLPSEGGDSGQEANRRSQVVEVHAGTTGHSVSSRSASHKHAHPLQNGCSERAPRQHGGTTSHLALKSSDHRYLWSLYSSSFIIPTVTRGIQSLFSHLNIWIWFYFIVNLVCNVM